MSERHQKGSRSHTRSRPGLLLFAFLCAAAGLRAQTASLPFQRLSTEQGLSQGTVNCILQDRTGFLWLGTQDGLNRYDGYGFLIYKNDPADPSSLPSNWISDLAEDPSGDIWVGTQGGGLARWRRATDTFERFQHDPEDPASLPGNSVRTLLVDRAGTLWIGTFQSGLGRMNTATNEFELFRHDPADPASLSDDRTRAIYEDRAGKLWIGTLGGLNRFEGGSFVRLRHDPAAPASLSDDRVFSILEDSRGAFWVGTQGGLNRFIPPRSPPGDGVSPARSPPGDEVVFPPRSPPGDGQLDTERGFERFRHDPDDPASLAVNWVVDLLEDRSGRLWIATDGGLCLLRPSPPSPTFACYRHNAADPLSLSNDRLLAISQDRGGLLWVGTQGGGVNKWNPATWSFVHYRSEGTGTDGLVDNNVFSFSEDRQGRLYIGTLGGLDMLERESGRFTHFRHDPTDPASLPSDQVTALYHDSNGVLWVGTMGGGLARREPGPAGTRTFRDFRHDPERPGSLTNDVVSAIIEDEDAGLWIATHGGGLNRFAAASERFASWRHDPADPESLSDDHLNSLAVDPGGALWVGTFGSGLNRLDPERTRFRRLRHDPERPASLSSDSISALHCDPAGNLWVGTQAGLNRLEPGGEPARFRHYFERDGLPNNSIWGIRSDDEGRLWISTNHGIARFDPAAETLKSYNTSHGLQSDEFNFGAHFRSAAGELFFGGVNGFNAFFPDKIETNTHVPPVVLTSFTKINRPVRFDRPLFDVDEISLTYHDYFFSLEFAALDYAAPEENRHRYKLEGLDPGWVDLGPERRVTFTNLDPGPYVLRLQGANNDGVWNEAGASIRISVAPPPWRTWWAYALYALAAATMVSGFIRMHHRKVERERAVARRERAQSEERRRLLEERERLILELEANKAELETFNYTVSHDLKNPLVTIKGFLGILRRDIVAGDQDRVSHDIRRIGDAADRMRTLLDELLELTRVGRRSLRSEAVNLGHLARQALELVDERDVEIEIAFDLPVVAVDRLRLLQVYQNLLANAVKYMGDQSSPRVAVGVRDNGGGPSAAAPAGDGGHARVPALRTPVFFVSDNGIGIDPRYHEKVFGLFERLDATDQGTGIGLALVKRIVELHGGRIWVESDGPGFGSTFCFTLGDAPERPSHQG